MEKLAVINGVDVELEVVDNAVYTTSLSVAEVFNKNHKNIIRKINEFPKDNFTKLNFEPSKYIDSTGRILPCYKITRDAFSFLVMGFTGEKAYKWKIEFIKAFNEMEKRLKSRSFNDLSLIDELKSSNLIKDEYKRQTQSLKDELLEIQRELLSFYRNKESKKQDEILENLLNPKHHGKTTKLSDDEKIQIEKLFHQGLGSTKIAKILGRGNFCNTKTNQNYKRRIKWQILNKLAIKICWISY